MSNALTLQCQGIIFVGVAGLPNLRALREHRKLSREMLSRTSKTPATTIRALEVGRVKDPLYSTVIKLAVALRVEPAELFTPIKNAMAVSKPSARRSRRAA